MCSKVVRGKSEIEFFKISTYAFIICIRFYNETVLSWSYGRRQANEEMVPAICRPIAEYK
jgi:hypothetical protein